MNQRLRNHRPLILVVLIMIKDGMFLHLIPSLILFFINASNGLK